MSLVSILSIARSALMAHRQAMTVTSNNVANVNTPGYTRQRLGLTPVAYGGPAGALQGGGVLASHITRYRDSFLDGSYREQSSFLGQSSTSRYFLEQVEAAINEPGDTGVAASLDGLFRAFGDLANSPDSPVAREEVRRAAELFAGRMRSLDTALNRSMDHAVEQLRAEVADVNAMTSEIAEINRRILAGGQGGASSPELLDQRDRLIDELSARLSISVRAGENGTVTVTTQGMTLVSNTSAHELALTTTPGGNVSLVSALGQGSVDPQSGSIKALNDLVSTTLPSLRIRLNGLAEVVVDEINALHASGTNSLGNTGVNLFDPAGVSAATIGLSAEVEASSDAVAAGYSGEAGDNRLALDLAALSGKGIAIWGGQTMGGYYTAFTASVGRSVATAGEEESAALALVSNADTWRASVGGVSIDEEMVQLIGQQEAYVAAARLVSTADEMIQELLNIV